jgi:apolipoprotein N-acyltransferase
MDENTRDKPENLRHLVVSRRWWRLGGALASGLLLSAAYPPLELGGLAWVALVPLLLVPVPNGAWGRFFLGWLFGFAYFGVSFNWLNQVGLGLGQLLAAVCACFPGLWYWALAALTAPRVAETATRAPAGAAIGWRLGLREIGQMLAAAIVWVGLEWARGWFLTGMPWNQLGVSQWRHLGLLRLTTVTGVYGISFLIVAANVTLWHLGRDLALRFCRGERRRIPWSVPALALLMAGSLMFVHSVPRLGPPDHYLQVAAVQGNIPQIRKWRPEQLTEALEVYTTLSRHIAQASKPDLIVWPETAVPAAIPYTPECQTALNALLQDLRTPFLLGSIDYQVLTTINPETDQADYLVFNAVMLVTPDEGFRQKYYKTHPVPFGEYTPLEKMWPWLTRLIGMGRSLTAGREFTVFDLDGQARAGANLCFEDVFPNISREFVLNQANILMTLTNDAWYAKSAGSRQHMIHAVFRAVENARPLLRSGNNSDTCLILPDGQVTGLLYDPVTGNRFVRGVRTYAVPVWNQPGLTWYTRHGDRFAAGCAVLAILLCLGPCYRWVRRKRALYDLIHDTDPR